MSIWILTQDENIRRENQIILILLAAHSLHFVSASEAGGGVWVFGMCECVGIVGVVLAGLCGRCWGERWVVGRASQTGERGERRSPAAEKNSAAEKKKKKKVKKKNIWQID